MTHNHEHALISFRLRLAALLTLRNALAFVTVWAFLWGTAVLVARAAFGAPRSPLLWGFAGLPLAVGPAVWLALRRLPPLTAVRALLDRRSGCGGLLMAGEEQPLGAWDQRMPELSLPQVRWRVGRAWSLFAVAAAFVALAFMMPQQLVALDNDTSLEVSREVEKLSKQIDVLKKEQILDAARADAFKKELEQIHDEASGKDPIKTLEALDHLQDVLTKTAKTASESATSKTEQMAKAEALADAMLQVCDKIPDKVKAQAMAEMTAFAMKAAKETGLLDDLGPEMRKALEKASTMKPEQMKKLADALRGNKKKLAEQVASLQKAGLLDLETLKKLAECGKCNSKELAALLGECDGKNLADLLAACNKPGGKGGGRSPGKMDFGKESTMDGVTFKEESLPPSALQELKESKVVGVSPTAPQVETSGATSKPGALSGAAAGGGAANTQVVLPRHRETVEKYFERPGPQKK
jgi:hypothetical protein